MDTYWIYNRIGQKVGEFTSESYPGREMIMDMDKLNELMRVVDNLIDNCPDYNTDAEWAEHNRSVTAAMQEWCNEYNKTKKEHPARVEDRRIILT